MFSIIFYPILYGKYFNSTKQYCLTFMSIIEKNDIMTMKELADYLKIAEKTAYRFASDKKIPGFKVGNAWRFRKSEIDNWIKKQEKTK